MADTAPPLRSLPSASMLVNGRPIGATFDVDFKHADRVDTAAQDPRVRTRIISDADLQAAAETGAVPALVKSSQKKRTDKGGLLGKMGFRDVDSTGMPDAFIKTMIATQSAPVMMPIGMLLYGAGSKQEGAFDPAVDSGMNMQFGFPSSSVPAKAPKPVPAPKGAKGNLPLYRCKCCAQYISKAEFGFSCTYHPGKLVNRGHGHWSYSCCGAMEEQPDGKRGCRVAPSHSEDSGFSEILLACGCNLSDNDFKAAERNLAAKFKRAYFDGHIAVEVKDAAESIMLSLLAPPLPTVGALKGVLHATTGSGKYLPNKTELTLTHGGEALKDSASLLQQKHLEITSENVVVHVLAVQGAPQIHPRADESKNIVRDGWKKVPLLPDDSLIKLAIKYDLTPGAIKVANGFSGNEIPGWLDEIWLPPEAEFGQMTRRPADKVEEFVWLLRGGNDGNGKKREGGRREPEREEVVAYLAMNDDNVQAAFEEWIADEGWEDQANEPTTSMTVTTEAADTRIENPLSETAATIFAAQGRGS